MDFSTAATKDVRNIITVKPERCTLRYTKQSHQRHSLHDTPYKVSGLTVSAAEQSFGCNIPMDRRIQSSLSAV